MAHDTPMSPRRGRTRTSVAAGPSVSTTLHAHLVFVTKYRRGVLDHAMLTDCEHVMRQVCTDLRSEPRGLDGEPDHVHLLVRHPPTVSLPAGQLPQRGLPAPLRAEHAGRVERAGTRGQPWPPSYFAASCGGAPLEIVKEYIRGQQRPGKQRLPPRAEGRGSRPGSPMIRAARLVAHGRPPELVQARAPTRSTGEAVVAVTAAPITPLDVLCATGTSYFGAPALPYVPGVQGVGTIVEGSHLAAGTRVWFPSSAGMTAGDGSLAELAIASAAELVPLPDGVPDELVAGLGLSAVAAWMSLTWRARLQPGESVLVLGAGGVVGQVAVQAARILGASRVVAAARSADSRERAMSYAPDDVVELRPGDDVAGLAARLEQACGGQVSVVIDPLCGVPGSAAAEVLSEGGRLVNLGSSAGATAHYSSATLRSRSAAILGYTNNSLTNEQRSDALTSLLRHAARGSLTVDHETVEWGDLPDAWARQADGEARRRIVVRIS